MLLGLVLAIWGIIGFRILGVFSPEREAVVAVDKLNFKPKEIVEKDTFSILADYRDPFLGTLSVAKKKTAASKPKQPAVAFPNIVYTGLITDQQTKANIFFVTIAGKQFLMQKRGMENEVTLISGNGKNIKVRYKEKLKTIPLQGAN